MMSESFCFNFFERLCNTLPKVLILDYFFLKYERWGGVKSIPPGKTTVKKHRFKRGSFNTPSVSIFSKTLIIV